MYLRGNRRLVPLTNTVAVLFIYLFLHQCSRRDVIENDPIEDTRATHP